MMLTMTKNHWSNVIHEMVRAMRREYEYPLLTLSLKAFRCHKFNVTKLLVTCSVNHRINSGVVDGLLSVVTIES